MFYREPWEQREETKLIENSEEAWDEKLIKGFIDRK